MPVSVRLEGGGPDTVSPGEQALRDDARAILEAALAAVDPAGLVEAALQSGEPAGRPVTLVAVGKAADAMARGAVRALGPSGIREGLILEPDSSPWPPGELLPGIHRRRGGHPLPSREGQGAAREVADLVAGGAPGDPVLLLLSGGGSALLTAPAEGITLEDLRTTTDLLLRGGASISEVNAVRKHLEELKGGGLARAAAPRPVTVLALSDVVGNRPDVIASGPASPDGSTFADALEALDRADARERVPASVRDRLERGARGALPETPGPGDPCFRAVDYWVVGSVATAVEAAGREARARGYRARKGSCRVEGEARHVGRRLAGLARRAGRGGSARGRPTAVVTGGETTVTVRGEGRGGPNQEVALAAALELEGSGMGALVASLGTDGVDGPTDAAGGVVSAGSAGRARAGGADPDRALEDNDARRALEAAGDLLVTGPTGTNVMDVQVVLAGHGLDEGAGSR